MVDQGAHLGRHVTFQPFVETGKLVSLLEEFLPPFPGFFLYFPQRRMPGTNLA
jgi:hypothetical protein